ncbi:MAG: hypothetical protein J5702_04045 [Bacteroidales bacterium]|nr:hypothetical protein [Bacteroidales bacterium]
MKRLLILLSAVLLVTGCGIGHYAYEPSYGHSYPESRQRHPSHSTASRSDFAGLAFFAERSKNIEVSVDHRHYRIKTLKYNANRNRRNFEKAVENTIAVRPGRHYVRVWRNGRLIFDQRINVYANGVQSIYL